MSTQDMMFENYILGYIIYTWASLSWEDTSGYNYIDVNLARMFWPISMLIKTIKALGSLKKK